MVMDNSKRNPSTANSKNPDFKESSQVNKETNENEGLPSRRGFAKVLSPVPKKKILAERNFMVDDAPPPPPPPPPFLAMETTTTPKVQGIRLILSSSGPGRSPSSSSSVASYDPVTNFTSPRPKFLRYNPNRRREILQRMEVGDMKDFECGGSSSTSSDQSGNEEEEEEEGLASLIESSASPPKPTSQEEDTKGGVEKDDSDYEVDDAMEEEVEERPWSRSRMVWKLLLIFGLFFISCHYLFPTTPSVVTPPPPPFHQEVETGGSEEITIPQRPTNWPYIVRLLTSHMGVSDLCLSGGEMMCPIDGHTCSSSSSSLVVDDDEEEIHMGSPAIREEEGFDNDLVMSEEVTGMVLEVVERDEEEDSSQAQGADTSVAIEERVDLSTSPALFEQLEDGSQREECEQKVEEAPSKDTEVEKRVQLFEETSHSTLAQNAPQVGQASEESRFSIISESAFRWNHHLVSRQLAPSFIFIWMSLLTAAAAAALFGFKYFLKPSSPPLLPCSSKSSIDEKKTDASVTTVVEEMRNIERRMKPAVAVAVAVAVVEVEEEESRDIDKEDLDRLREKYGGESLSSYARRQMLGDQFSLAESEIGGGGGGQTFKRIEPEREEGGSEECQYNKMMRSSTRKSPPSSSNKQQLHPSSTKSNLEGSYRPGKKLRKTDQDSSNKSEEEKMVVTTPLRRSDRLRKRVTSP